MPSTATADIVNRATASGDASGRLPPRARLKFAAMRAQAEDSGAAMRELAEKRASLGQRRIAQRSYVETLQASARRGYGRTPPSAPLGNYDLRPGGSPVPHYAPADGKQVAAAEADLTQIEAEFRKIGERIAAHDLRQSPIVARISEWLRRLPVGTVLADANDLPTLGKGVRPSLAAVEAARADVARLKRVIEEIRAAPIPTSEARTIVAAEVEAMAARGEPDLLRTIELGRPPAWPMIPQNQLGAIIGARVDIIDAAALFAWTFKEELLERLYSELDEVSDDATALSTAERLERDGEARDKLFAAERLEELLIAEGELDGLVVPRRPDANPYAVLGLRIKGES